MGNLSCVCLGRNSTSWSRKFGSPKWAISWRQPLTVMYKGLGTIHRKADINAAVHSESALWIRTNSKPSNKRLQLVNRRPTNCSVLRSMVRSVTVMPSNALVSFNSITGSVITVQTSKNNTCKILLNSPSFLP